MSNTVMSPGGGSAAALVRPELADRLLSRHCRRCGVPRASGGGAGAAGGWSCTECRGLPALAALPKPDHKYIRKRMKRSLLFLLHPGLAVRYHGSVCWWRRGG